MAEVDFRSPMSTAKLFGNVWHGSHWDVHPLFGLKVLSWIMTHGFRRLFRQNVCRITVNLILPSPLAWERPNNYSFGEVAQLGEWHLHLMAYGVWRMTFLAQSQNLMPPGHNRVAATPKGRWKLTQRGSTTKKTTPVSRKTAGKTSTELGSQPGDIQIATESVASICKLCCTPRKVERTHHSFIRMLLQVLIFSKIIQDPFEIWKWPKLVDWMWQVVRLLAQLR